MTSRDLILSIEEGNAHQFSSMSEGYVYLYLRSTPTSAETSGFHDRTGDHAQRQSTDHPEAHRHTDYKALDFSAGAWSIPRFAEPWSVESIARDYFNSLAIGAEY